MSAKYSPIAPLPLLWQLHERGILGNYLLLLAHEVLAEPLGYSDLVAQLESPCHIIMDNGVVELGEGLNVVDVVEAANYVDADCIIMPDVLGSFIETQKQVMAQIIALRNSGFDIMKVPQGSNVGELVLCVDWIREYLPPIRKEPDYWGIPRWVANEMGSRIPIIQYINAVCDNPVIHLLGTSQNQQDDLRCTKLPGVIGIDSANPLVMGFAGKMLEVGHTYVHMDRGSFFKQKQITGCVESNVRWMHNACS